MNDKELKFIADEVYDILFENNTVQLNLPRNFPESWIDCDKGIIYLEGNPELGSYKITVERA
jgi:hypothetical protein